MSAQQPVDGSPAPRRAQAGEDVVVPQIPPRLPPSWAVRLLVLRRVVGPLRRRWWKVDPNPPPPLTGRQILERVAELPISFWSYEFEPGVRHLGPMAQDFAAAFGLGRTNRLIEGVDECGVALTAVQASYRRVQKLEARVQQLEAEVVRLQAAERERAQPQTILE